MFIADQVIEYQRCEYMCEENNSCIQNATENIKEKIKPDLQRS